MVDWQNEKIQKSWIATADTDSHAFFLSKATDERSPEATK